MEVSKSMERVRERGDGWLLRGESFRRTMNETAAREGCRAHLSYGWMFSTCRTYLELSNEYVLLLVLYCDGGVIQLYRSCYTKQGRSKYYPLLRSDHHHVRSKITGT
jgi:hypothetical protein